MKINLNLSLSFERGKPQIIVQQQEEETATFTDTQIHPEALWTADELDRAPKAGRISLKANNA